MKRQTLSIENIPAILWGDKSDHLCIAVHGNMSHKADDAMVVFAAEAVAAGYQVLSFDLPEHGDRKNEPCACKVQNCVQDLTAIMRYAKSLAKHISVFACSMGAYFSLLAYSHEPLKQCLFLSPVVDMERIIHNMMTWFNVSEDRLKAEKEIPTPIGQTLYWDYYCYVKEHPIAVWDKPTSILYGSEDTVCELDAVAAFAKRFRCDLQVMEQGEHYFHTKEQLEFFRQWLKKCIEEIK
jgi:alpha-beta hydrolase superfamily lysophospholipase